MKATKISLIALFLFVIGFITYRSIHQADRIVYATVTPQKRNISESLYIPGNVFPIKEIEVKSQLSGILDKTFVHIGDHVTIGTPIASVKLVPGTSDLEKLESNVNLTQINLHAQQMEYNREKDLYDKELIAQEEMDEATRAYLTAKENYVSAKNLLDLQEKGSIVSKNISNIVTASTTGTIIDLPLESGASVVERNNYNPGTTIAVVAQTNLFRFKTLVPEQHLKHIALRDTVTLTFNAYDSLSVKAIVSEISSKGSDENGIMKYPLYADFKITSQIPTLRSGYSATAAIILKQRKNVLSIEEKYITYKDDSAYLYIQSEREAKEEKRNIITGISDGTYTEVISGISPEETIVTDNNDDKIK
ncbi:MAG: efflux RND transporter periplasmic adaptor subunit [Mediterranea sp.]|nr:efflux RND transporter periplasmic adaptor subunit [Mediterranea sp.]